MSSKKAQNELKQGFQEFEEKDIVEQSLALVDIVKDLLETTKQHLNKIYVILVVSLLANLIIVGAFLWYESHLNTTVETSTEPVQIIPKDWYGFTRKDVTPQVRTQYIEKVFEDYCSWEKILKKVV